VRGVARGGGRADQVVLGAAVVLRASGFGGGADKLGGCAVERGSGGACRREDEDCIAARGGDSSTWQGVAPIGACEGAEG